ncbi:hypothetical protein HRW14_21300 [Streptomyces lunaelactis]|uniref:hypothetical protein n=1 Tax=Streptomyces lunaelactis TaxID=1535768 RepID=UPI0015845F3E|nr:hypothetical protein [Streptomyces lunaelactis]NUK03409.1 hypothetical protein [Streptomyces lunaelactis]NUK20525.1 hypothetical protein [Streptomyces lunaelactis]NUK24929.1 hypothetical protein [Streptomyces lunaelactis]NUK52770.1 hypothetical protein [Streptomyces lunaelactis]NUK66579.1 hypothetical protein [Streptomyces lunaelactis]
MGGTDDAVDEDALYVLTAVLLTPAQFPSVLGDDFPAACAALNLEPCAEGYGLVLGQDSEGARWTVVVDDVSLVAVAIASWDCGMEYDLSPGERTMIAALPGWPLAVAVAAPGVPAPHDPAPEEGDRPPLAPPDTDAWGPAQRRLGADEIALQWAQWRQQIGDDEMIGASATPDTSDVSGTSEGDRKEEPKPEPKAGHAGVRRALKEAREYLESAPPAGRVRSSFAPNGARTLRADGPGWSMVARTDDIAFVLLDDEPCEVLPVGRGPELPGLLESLDKIAVRPA